MKRLKLVMLLSMGVLPLLAMGCATMFSGTHQTVTFQSNPPGANVTAGKFCGTTPCSLTLDKGSSYQVRIEKEGYKPFTTQIGTSYNAVHLVNLLWGIPGIVIGTIVDFASGAMMNLNTDAVSVTLERGKE